MTLSTTTVSQSFSGDGSTVAFTFTFPINSTSEITVIERSSTGTETVKSEGTGSTNYGIVDNGASGGVVTMVTAPASGTTLVILRNTNLTQETDYVANDPFLAESHESALDKLQMQIQEVQEEVDRSIKISRTNTMTSKEFTENAASRASKVLSFDSSGELSVTNEIGNWQGNWATSTAYSLRDIVKQNSSSDSATYKNVYICTTAHTSTGSYLTQNDTSNWAVLVETAAFDTVSELSDTTISSVASGNVLIYDGSDSWDNKAISGDATLASTGALTIAADAIESGMLNDNIISGQTALTSGLASTDELIFSDAGSLKRMDVSVLTTYNAALSETLTNKTLTSPVLNTGVSGTAVKDEDDMSSDSATHLATQQSIKAYVDSQIATEDTIAELNDTTISSVASANILIYDGSDSWDNKAISGDATISAAGALTIASGAVETGMIAADAITGAKIADDAINSEHYTDGSIDTAHIADLQVTTAKIAADAITGAKIADDALDSEHYTDGSIDTAHIADSQVTTAKIADDNVTQAKIADDAVGADQLAASAVVTASIVDDNVTQAKIADDAVGADQLAANAVVNASVASGAAIADSKLATISTANKVSLAALDIDGGTEIGADIVDADLFIIDDGAGGTNKKVLASRIKTYAASSGATAGFAVAMAIAL
jgi:uncharacterized protein YggL (DUF469 family)